MRVRQIIHGQSLVELFLVILFCQKERTIEKKG
jgi:hypothetical protein